MSNYQHFFSLGICQEGKTAEFAERNSSKFICQFGNVSFLPCGQRSLIFVCLFGPGRLSRLARKDVEEHLRVQKGNRGKNRQFGGNAQSRPNFAKLDRRRRAFVQRIAGNSSRFGLFRAFSATLDESESVDGRVQDVLNSDHYYYFGNALTMHLN